jgi:hypothetical protein
VVEIIVSPAVRKTASPAAAVGLERVDGGAHQP